MADHDPKTSPTRIVRYNKTNADEQQVVVKRVKGKAATIKALHRLRAEEADPGKYAYYWSWENQSAAHEYEAERAGLKNKPKVHKRKS